MSLYQDSYGTDWESLDEDEAMERAYALGVASSLGEYHPDELDAIREQMDSSYQRSVVDLAFEEGKNEGQNIDPPGDGDADANVWAELVEGETVTVDPDDVPTDGTNSIPDALEKIDIIEKPDLDSTDAVDMPDFLQNDPD
jgi:hypothetical protein